MHSTEAESDSVVQGTIRHSLNYAAKKSQSLTTPFFVFFNLCPIIVDAVCEDKLGLFASPDRRLLHIMMMMQDGLCRSSPCGTVHLLVFGDRKRVQDQASYHGLCGLHSEVQCNGIASRAMCSSCPSSIASLLKWGQSGGVILHLSLKSKVRSNPGALNKAKHISHDMPEHSVENSVLSK
eukprot:6107718-Amphidinium_carterae.1